MLGKLLKYDLKALSRVLIPVHLAAVAVTFVACGAALTGYAVNELPSLVASDYANPIIAAAEGFAGSTDIEDVIPYWIMRASTGYGLFGSYAGPTVLEVALTFVQTVVQMAFGLLMAYAAFALGAALAQRHKVAAGIGLYVALSWGYGFLAGAVSVLGVFATGGIGSVTAYYALTSALGTLLQVVACGALWLICLWVLKRKVNLP